MTKNNTVLNAINVRYTDLATSSCCLSCGGAINHAKPKKGEICVDLGSGRGTDVMRLADSVDSNGFVYGIDISSGMLETAKNTARRLEYKNVEFFEAELEKLPLKENSANLVISNCTINHAKDKNKVWAEIFRILKPGGRFVISDIYSNKPVPKKYANDPTAVAECWAGSVTKKEYLETLDKVGFGHLTVLEESDPYEKGKIMVSSWTIYGKKLIKEVN